MESLIQKICEVYGLKLKFLEKVSKGHLSDNVIMNDGDIKYFIKKYRFKNIDKVREIHLVKKYFHDGGVPVILPIITKNGEYFFQNQESLYAIFPFINGRQLEGSNLTKNAIVSLAKVQAKIHLLGKDANVNVQDRFKGWDKQRTLSQIDLILQKIDSINEKNSFDLLAKKNVLLKKDIVSSNILGYESFDFVNDHLIHGDYMIFNVFFDSEDNISHVLDFEKTKYAPRFFELFRSIVLSLSFKDGSSDESVKFLKIYFDTYRYLYPISAEEFLNGFSAWYLYTAHSVWVESEHYLNGNFRVDDLLESDAERIDYFYKNIDTLKGRLC